MSATANPLAGNILELEEELAAIRAERARIVERRDAHPELDHHKVPAQLAVLDKWIRRYEQMLEIARACA